MNDGRINLADVGVVCATDDRGRPITSLADGDPTLEAIEAFADFLAVAGPPGRTAAFSLDYWAALDRVDPRTAARLDHHADRWAAQLSIGWHG